MKPVFKSMMVLVLGMTLSACKDPVKEMKKEIKKLGYIPYTTPLEHSGTGTLIGGKPSQLQLVAPPQRCFPDSIENIPTELRFIDKTTLGKKIYHMSASGDARFGIMKFLNFGNSLGNIGLAFDRVKKLHLEMSGVTVEYFDSILLAKYYREAIPETCKDYLDHVGFIIQALKVEKLSFKFEDNRGYLIDLQANIPTKYIDLSTRLKWNVSERYELEITTPKYMGYQLGRLSRQDNGIALMRASKSKRDRFEFKTMSLFGELSTQPSVRGLTLGRVTLMEERPSIDQMIRMGLLPSNFIRPW